MSATYIPQCEADGSFSPKQCDRATGYCWCVDENGGKIPGTNTPPGRLVEIKCSFKGKSNESFRSEVLGLTRLKNMYHIAFCLDYVSFSQAFNLLIALRHGDV